jgi:hypothetical protein
MDTLEYLIDDYGIPPNVAPSYGRDSLFDQSIIRLAPSEAFYSWGCFYVLVDEHGKPWHLHEELTQEEQAAVSKAVSRCIERERLRRDRGLPLITAHQIWQRCGENQERFNELANKLVRGEMDRPSETVADSRHLRRDIQFRLPDNIAKEA